MSEGQIVVVLIRHLVSCIRNSSSSTGNVPCNPAVISAGEAGLNAARRSQDLLYLLSCNSGINIWGQNDLPALPVTPEIEQVDSSYETTILPSSHHRWPFFRPFSAFAPPPATPLNMYLLDIFATASKSISFLTPNLTSPPILSALLDALKRGIDVTVITNRRMMILEQLLTAGTITEFCVWKFRRRYRKLIAASKHTRPVTMEEGLMTNPGNLCVGYFISDSRYTKSHIKCTIIDEEILVLGSVNMDRTSWYTSQELGITLEGVKVVRDVWQSIEKEILSGGGVEWL